MKVVHRMSVLASIVLVVAFVLLVWGLGCSKSQTPDVPVPSTPARGPAIQDEATPHRANLIEFFGGGTIMPIPSEPARRPAIPHKASMDSSDAIEAFAMRPPFVTQVPLAYPVAPPAEVVELLESKRATGQTDHLAFLLEYGLRVHQKCLEYTGLARALPLEENMMLAELVRLAEIPKYTNAHEAGWLNNQFDDHFCWTGYSSYQIYIWAKENIRDVLSYPNWRRIAEIMDAIDKSGRNGVGGGMVCHYGCVP